MLLRRIRLVFIYTISFTYISNVSGQTLHFKGREPIPYDNFKLKPRKNQVKVTYHNEVVMYPMSDFEFAINEDQAKLMLMPMRKKTDLDLRYYDLFTMLIASETHELYERVVNSSMVVGSGMVQSRIDYYYALYDKNNGAKTYLGGNNKAELSRKMLDEFYKPCPLLTNDDWYNKSIDLSIMKYTRKYFKYCR